MNCHCNYCTSDNKSTPDLIDLMVKWFHNKWDVRDLLHYTWGNNVYGKNIKYAELSIMFRNKAWYLLRITLPDKLSIRLNPPSAEWAPHSYDWSNYYNISNKEDWEYVESHIIRLMKYIGIGEMPQNHEQNTSI